MDLKVQLLDGTVRGRRVGFAKLSRRASLMDAVRYGSAWISTGLIEALFMAISFLNVESLCKESLTEKQAFLNIGVLTFQDIKPSIDKLLPGSFQMNLSPQK